jgi:uncharacterized membrane protein HdeD (DUF308 family)
METSQFLAKLLGLYCVIVSGALLINRAAFQAFLRDEAKHPGFLLLSGFLALIVGLLIILSHNIWRGWPILVTLIGYLALFKGIVRLYFTHWTNRVIRGFAESPQYIAMVTFSFVLGMVLIYFGWMA